MTKLSSFFHGSFISIWFHGEVKLNKRFKQTMINFKMIAGSMLAASLLAGCACKKSEDNQQAQQSKLMAEARVSKEDAGKTALAKVSNGMIKESELEKEHGKLLWSFEVVTSGTKDIIEVNVDAITGDVISVDKESSESEAKEAAGKNKN